MTENPADWGAVPLQEEGPTAWGAVPVEADNPIAWGATPVDQTSLSDYPIEFAKGVAEGAKNLGASALKGYGAASIGQSRDQLEAMRNAPTGPIDDSPEARAAWRVKRSVIHP